MEPTTEASKDIMPTPTDSPLTSASDPSITTMATSPSLLDENAESDDDFFGSSPPNSSHGTPLAPSQTRHDLQSDVPQLRRIHVTNGYREGLSAAKETTLQIGFDEGFPVGAAAALRVGWALGVLQGLERSGKGENRKKLPGILKKARDELGLKELVEVMTAEEEEKTLDESGEERLVMEDVRIKERVLEGWEKDVQKVLDGIAVN